MQIKIALAGNPNSGKTTMFNDLTGNSQYVGNWPGVTVEKKEGKLKGNKDVLIQDLPGIYSLSPYTLEEVVTRNYLLNEHPDAILNIVDGSNLERNLYLTTQLLEIGIPTVVALNMIDVVRKNGDAINMKKLSEALGCDVIETSALKGEGTNQAALKAAELAKTSQKKAAPSVFGGAVEHAIAHIEDIIKNNVDAQKLRFYAIKLFERDKKIIEQLQLGASMLVDIEEITVACEAEMDDDAESIITNERYAYISKVISTCLQKKTRKGNMTTSDKIDKIVTNRVLALPIFILVMFLVYFVSVTTVGAIVTDFTNDTLFGEWIMEPLGGWLESIGTADWLNGLVVDGIVGGVGAVLGFVPQMLILFLFLAVLEDVGYMARVAFIMDRIFRKFGLSGKSFIPMLIGSGCSVPGIMASRTIENERDRRMTIMTTSFIPCGAKMPIVGLIAGAVFGGAWWVAPSAYFIGVAAVIVSGIILKKTKKFAGDPAPFVMELPSYHAPRVINVLRSMWERGWSFIKRAGTIILLASVVVWFLLSFGFVDGAFGMVEDMNESVLASIGNVVAPLFAPLGFGSWQASVASILGLVAKEEVVGALGTMANVAGDALEMVEEGAFGELTGIAAFLVTPLSAFSFLLFNLLCAPCFAAMGAIRREMNSAKWTWFAIGYLCGFAYAIALIVNQLGLLFTGGGFTIWTAVALLVLAGLLYMLFRKPYDERHKLEAAQLQM
ncbi:ferrous iron transport protein B [Christensenellaceae bacterium OttesenSCG-928-M15]|nr:ferrous iron transport protein B [Christensenellaceae bacterium OttesenSCG-928-M15]